MYCKTPECAIRTQREVSNKHPAILKFPRVQATLLEDRSLALQHRNAVVPPNFHHCRTQVHLLLTSILLLQFFLLTPLLDCLKLCTSVKILHYK